MITVKAVITRYEGEFVVDSADEENKLSCAVVGEEKTAWEAARNFLVDYEYTRLVMHYLRKPFAEARFIFVGEGAESLPDYIVKHDRLVTKALYDDWFHSLGKKRQAKIRQELGMSEEVEEGKPRIEMPCHRVKDLLLLGH